MLRKLGTFLCSFVYFYAEVISSKARKFAKTISSRCFERSKLKVLNFVLVIKSELMLPSDLPSLYTEGTATNYIQH